MNISPLRQPVRASLAAMVGGLFCCVLGCGGKDAGDSAQGNTLRLAVETQIHSLDPAIAYDTFSWPLIRLLYHGLLDYDDGTNLVPWLAEEMPGISEDGRTYTFRLRKGVLFSNGREVLAGDFVYSLERILDPETASPGESFYRNIVGAREFQEARKEGPDVEPLHVEGLQALDDYSLEISLLEPDLAFLNVMAMTFAYAVPREAVEEHGDDFFRNPVGTGPFLLTEWVRGMRLQMVRNPRYTAGEPARLDGIHVMIGGDTLIHQMMFERGELDLKDGIPIPDFVRITTDPKWEPYLVKALDARTVYLPMNCEMEPFTDVRVRRAVNYGIDKERVLKLITGRAVPAHGVLPPSMPGYNPELRSYEFDPEKARALLAEAGYAEGFELPLWVRSDTGYEVKVAEAIQQDLAQVGIKLDIRPVAFGTLIDILSRRGGAEFGVFGWSQDYPDPSNFLDVLLNGERIVEVNCNNAAFYSNPEVNALLAEAAAETDAARRLGIYGQVEQMVVDDAPWVCLYHPVRYNLRQPWLRGHAMHPVWPQRLDTLWLDRDDPSWEARP